MSGVIAERGYFQGAQWGEKIFTGGKTGEQWALGRKEKERNIRKKETNRREGNLKGCQGSDGEREDSD